MSSVNKAIVVGNLGKDPEVRRTQAGKAIVSFSVATSERWRDKATGERKERTHWHNVVVFDERLAEVAEKHLKKGSKVYVEGAMQTRKWQDQSGQDRWTTEIVLSAFRSQLHLLDRVAGRPAPSEEDYGAAKSRDDGIAPRQAAVADEIKDEIPF